jgi:hypothetical protein
MASYRLLHSIVTVTAAVVFPFFSSYGQVEWTKRNPYEKLNGVVWASNQLVAVGNGGAIATSPEGDGWTYRNSGTRNTLTSVTWGNNQYVVVGDSGTILSSPDGISWAARSTGPKSYWLSSVIWTDSGYIAVGSGGVVVSSPAGNTWTQRNVGSGFNLFSIASSGQTFVAVGGAIAYASIFTSTDGVTWKETSLGTTDRLYFIEWTGTEFAAVGMHNNGQYAILYTSPDAATWKSSKLSSMNPFYSMCFANNKLLVVGDCYADNFNAAVIDPVSDSAVWHSALGTLYSVAWTGSRYVAVGADGFIALSPDGAVWTHKILGITTKDLTCVTWAGNQFVAIGDSGTVLTSPDGIDWTKGNCGVLGELRCITWTGTKLVAGGGNYITTSPDAVHWTRSQVDTTHSIDIYSIASTGTFLSAVGSGGYPLTSAGGTAWTSNAPSGTTDIMSSVVWNGTVLAAAAWSRGVFTSHDGITWTGGDLNTSNDLMHSIVWTGANFVAVGGNENSMINYSGVIYASVDGATWLPESSGTRNTLHAVIQSTAGLVAVGRNGTVLTSQGNGTTWTTRNSKSQSMLLSVACSGSMFVAVGWGGTVLTSPLVPNNVVPRETGPAGYLRPHISVAAVRNNRIFANLAGFSPGRTVTLRIFDAAGRSLLTLQNNAFHSACIPAAHLAPGHYFLQAVQEGVSARALCGFLVTK